MKFVLASHNRGKLREMQQLLAPLGAEVVLPADLGIIGEAEETGRSFAENSMIKARAVFDACGLATIADDSGLMVDALDGAPGVYSARFGAPACKTDADRNALLLRKLELVPDPERGAQFVCAVTCILPDGTVLTAQGICRGEILRANRGDNGFGYDPLFYVPQEGLSFAELPAERKNQISHRARAFAELKEKLIKYEEERHAEQ